MGVLTNKKHEKFAQNLVKMGPGVRDDDAYVAAGYKSGPANASRLKNSPELAARVKELLGHAAARVIVNRAYVLGGLRANADRCMSHGDERNPTAANRALELLGKEIGMFIDRRLLGIRNIDDMSEDEILVFLGGEPESSELSAAAGTPPLGHA